MLNILIGSCINWMFGIYFKDIVLGICFENMYYIK